MGPKDLKPEMNNFAVAVLVSAHIYNYTTSSRLPNHPLSPTFIFVQICEKLRNIRKAI